MEQVRSAPLAKYEIRAVPYTTVVVYDVFEIIRDVDKKKLEYKRLNGDFFDSQERAVKWLENYEHQMNLRNAAAKKARETPSLFYRGM